MAAEAAQTDAEIAVHAVEPVSEAEYLDQYAAAHHEWVKGELVKMTPVSAIHDLLTAYLRWVFDAYLTLNPVGIVRSAPFVMRLEAVGSYREPDLQVILNTNPGNLTDTAMIGPADICVEVVSPESVARDYGTKFQEYEQAGVREYWLIDPQRRNALFRRLQESGLYETLQADADGHYTTPLLPRLRMHVPTLWQDTLPDVITTVEAVKAMMAGDE
jgi:Uma2 family endonuclease